VCVCVCVCVYMCVSVCVCKCVCMHMCVRAQAQFFEPSTSILLPSSVAVCILAQSLGLCVYARFLYALKQDPAILLTTPWYCQKARHNAVLPASRHLTTPRFFLRGQAQSCLACITSLFARIVPLFTYICSSRQLTTPRYLKEASHNAVLPASRHFLSVSYLSSHVFAHVLGWPEPSLNL